MAVPSRRQTSALGRIAAFESDKHIADTPFSMDFATVKYMRLKILTAFLPRK